jgi:phospholipase C
MGRSTISRIVIIKILILILTIKIYRPQPVFADGDITKVNHIIVLMQTSHSFDNYFGALAYAPGSPYHNGNGACDPSDSSCVNGLTCTVGAAGNVNCSNQNIDVDGSPQFSFHGSTRCAMPAIDSSWFFTHLELNVLHPNRSTLPRNNGFLLAKNLAGLIGSDDENVTADQTMAYYNQRELPFYYDLAQKFAIGDNYFSSVPGPAFPNRSYLMTATSFGHLTTRDRFPPPGGYKPVTGTIFDLFNANGVSWANYFQDVPQAGSFLPFTQTSFDPHLLPLSTFLAQAAGMPGVGALPQVSFVDPNFGLANPDSENDERPPSDIQRGQAFMSQVINAVRNGPYWPDSVNFITYDQHGGFYDHVLPPLAAQGGARTPDGIAPGQCADLSNPPLSQQPGGGAECWANPFRVDDGSVRQAELLCQSLTFDPTGPYPAWCASFDEPGVRVRFLAVSPFSKPHFVSHTIGDHTSILSFIEARFLSPDGALEPLFLTGRDRNASAFRTLFDFDNSPSLNTTIIQASPPNDDCTTPTGIAPTGVAPQHRVLLSWDASPSPAAAYAVFRSGTSGGPYVKLNVTPDGITSYTDSSVVTGQTYYYVVATLDPSGYQSNYSSEVSAVIPNQ